MLRPSVLLYRIFFVRIDMFNLLSRQDKLSLKAEYNRRKFVVALYLLATTLVISSIFLFPSHLVSSFKHSDIAQTAEILKNNIAIKNREDLNALIEAANKKITALSVGSDIQITKHLADISEYRTAGIRLTGFAFGYSEKDKKTLISLKGIAADRETLLAFAESLKSDPAYEEVDLPISNFTRERDINFTMTIFRK